MKPAIQLLLIQIMQLVAQCANNSRYQVFMDLAGHVSTVSVRIYAHAEEWKEGTTHKPIATATAYYDISDWDWLTEEERELRLNSELLFMHAALHAYLPTNNVAAAELQEAA